MKFTLEIDTDSTAMRTRYDIQEAINNVANDLLSAVVPIERRGASGIVVDRSKRAVGKWKLTPVLNERMFVALFPGGISYADREEEEDGDYKRLAFLPYDTLELEFHGDCTADVREWITRDAAGIQARRGQYYQISHSGKAVLLGSKL